MTIINTPYPAPPSTPDDVRFGVLQNCYLFILAFGFNDLLTALYKAYASSAAHHPVSPILLLPVVVLFLTGVRSCWAVVFIRRFWERAAISSRREKEAALKAMTIFHMPFIMARASWFFILCKVGADLVSADSATLAENIDQFILGFSLFLLVHSAWLWILTAKAPAESVRRETVWLRIAACTALAALIVFRTLRDGQFFSDLTLLFWTSAIFLFGYALNVYLLPDHYTEDGDSLSPGKSLEGQHNNSQIAYHGRAPAGPLDEEETEHLLAQLARKAGLPKSLVPAPAKFQTKTAEVFDILVNDADEVLIALDDYTDFAAKTVSPRIFIPPRHGDQTDIILALDRHKGLLLRNVPANLAKKMLAVNQETGVKGSVLVVETNASGIVREYEALAETSNPPG